MLSFNRTKLLSGYVTRFGPLTNNLVDEKGGDAYFNKRYGPGTRPGKM